MGYWRGNGLTNNPPWSEFPTYHRHDRLNLLLVTTSELLIKLSSYFERFLSEKYHFREKFVMGQLTLCFYFQKSCREQIHIRDTEEGLVSVMASWEVFSLLWRHNGRNGVSNHQPHGCLLNRLFRRRSKKTAKLRVTGLCVGNSPLTGEFPAQMASNAENVSMWWRHHVNNKHTCEARISNYIPKYGVECDYLYITLLYKWGV